VKVRFLKVAQEELSEAVRYYESQVPGLGGDFLLAATAAIERIVQYPEAWQRVDAELRRCRLGKFPYGLIFTAESEELLIVAVSHLHERPRAWRDRIEYL
jgi:toxin ParE2